MRQAIIGASTVMIFLLAAGSVAICESPDEFNGFVVGAADSQSDNASFSVRPHVLTAVGPADNSKFVNDVVQPTAIKWVGLAPSKTRPPQLKTGTVVITFVLHWDGKVTNMVLKKSSGDEELDQAAWLSIVRCGPYHAFPVDIRNAELNLQFTFVYNGKPEASQTSVFTPVFK